MDSQCCLSGRKCNRELRSSNVEKRKEEETKNTPGAGRRVEARRETRFLFGAVT